MATKPTSDYEWATDASYDSDAEPNKIEPPSVLRENGWERGEEPGAQHVNEVLHAHGEWLGWSEESIDDLEDRFDANGEIDLPAPILFTKYIGANKGQWKADAYDVLPSEGLLTIKSDGPLAQVFFDLTEVLSRNASIVRIRALVDPGAARSGGNRMVLSLWGASYGISFLSPSITLVQQGGAGQEDDGTTNLQWVTLDYSGAPVAVNTRQTWMAAITAGNTASSANDLLYALAIEQQTQKLTNL